LFKMVTSRGHDEKRTLEISQAENAACVRKQTNS